MNGNLLEVKISDVSITNVGFAIFLKPVKAESERVLPIFIGPLETYSISSAIDGVAPPRPNTHDLIVNMLREMDARVLHVIINDIVGNIFYARIVIQDEDGIVEVDARPSDSVAIAIRSHCPIFVSEKVFEESAVIIGDEGKKEAAAEVVVEPLASDSPDLSPLTEIERLSDQLRRAVDEENFEEAAKLRDRINQLAREN
jgi:hypothetical protein